jgi:hypothetical protein
MQMRFHEASPHPATLTAAFFSSGPDAEPPGTRDGRFSLSLLKGRSESRRPPGETAGSNRSEGLPRESAQAWV